MPQNPSLQKLHENNSEIDVLLKKNSEIQLLIWGNKWKEEIFSKILLPALAQLYC